MNPVHQYEPHDAPCCMDRDLYIGLFFGCCAIVGFLGVTVWGAAWLLGVVGW
jgi:hypothetical protein